MVQVITWNVDQKMSYERAKALANWLSSPSRAPDVILLQEVVCGRDSVFEDALSSTHHWFYGRQRDHRGLHGAAVAVSRKFDAEQLGQINDIAPELTVAVRSPQLGDILSVHIPNGTGWGWDKMMVWQQVRSSLGICGPRVILGGDFNAPALEGGRKTYCFGYSVATPQGRKDMSPAIAASLRELDLPETYWGEWDFANRPEGTTGDGRAWEEIESWIYNDSGLDDAYLRADRKRDGDLGHSHYAGGRYPVRYDHVFTRGYQSHEAGYLRGHIRKHAEQSESVYSDHAPLVVTLS
jgi:endonuclease/exonuclease/phosphatase (EEP) superfamily protein YafD